MMVSKPVLALLFAQAASAATVYLAGDSTMARLGGGSGTGTDGTLPTKSVSFGADATRMGTIPWILPFDTCSE